MKITNMKKYQKKKKILLISIILIILSITSFLVIYTITNQINESNEVPHISFTTEELLDSAVMAGDYLAKSVKESGEFTYEYDSLNDVESNNYNILRHSGTIYSMLQLYPIIDDKNILDQAEKAINYLLLQFSKPYTNESLVIVENNEIKLGGNALAIIALVEHAKATGKMDYIENMQDLAKYIMMSQKENGEFISKTTYSTGEKSDFISLYYPGEAILSLCRLYDIDQNETWLDVAEKGAKYLIELRKDIPTESLVHDHWLVIALNELYRYRTNPIYFNHSLRISKSIMNMQRDGKNRIPEDPEWLGSYYTPPRSTPTAIRTEALIAAYHLSKDFGDMQNSSQLLNSIKLGIHFQLKTQFTLENVNEFPNPFRTLGGFHETFDNYVIRIDIVQHNLCAIIGLYQIIELEKQ